VATRTWRAATNFLAGSAHQLYTCSVVSASPAAARICCLDLDTFFVSVERLLDPSLNGKPVIVGAMPGQRGVVTACSYEVRVFGVRSGMSMRDARQLAPDAIYLPTRHGTYSPYSKRVREVLDRYSPTVRAASIDEFYIDFSGCERLYRRPGDVDGDATIERLLDEIRATIKAEIGLPCSAGIGTSRAVAKIASGRAKPAGTLMVRAGQERAFLAPLSVRKFPGIGPVAERRLIEAGIETLGELIAAVDRGGMGGFRGMGMRVKRVLEPKPVTRWKAERPAFREHDPEGVSVGSISNERTFMADIGDDRRIRNQLRSLAERVSWRARRRHVHARTVTLKLRYSDFQTLTRGMTIAPTDNERDILRCVLALYEKAHTRRAPIRLLGVALSNLVLARRQLELPFDGRPRPKIGAAVDAIRKQFGYDAIRLGTAGDRSRWLA